MTRKLWNLYGFPLLLVAAGILTVLAISGRPGSSTTDFLIFYQSGRQFLAVTWEGEGGTCPRVAA